MSRRPAIRPAKQFAARVLQAPHGGGATPKLSDATEAGRSSCAATGAGRASCAWPVELVSTSTPKAGADIVVRLREERWRLAYGIPVRARGLLLGTYIKEWLSVTRSRVRPRTYDAYELSLHRIERLLGAVPLTRLNPHLIQRAYAELLAGGLSARTVLQSHAVLHRALKQARDWGLTNALPTELVAVPRPRQREMRALSAAQLSTLFGQQPELALVSALGPARYGRIANRGGARTQVERRRPGYWATSGAAGPAATTGMWPGLRRAQVLSQPAHGLPLPAGG